jgi:putative two-component system hydrogenase maturation factor HypX/HoxX
MSTGQCERLVSAIRHAASQDTRVLVIRGGEIFSNGIHLNVIEAAPNPELEAWHNINAIDDVCREIITCARQLVVSSVGGNAGAGGVMLALGADEVLLREGVVLNPHYRTMGPTYSRAGSAATRRRCSPRGASRSTPSTPPAAAWSTT